MSPATPPPNRPANDRRTWDRHWRELAGRRSWFGSLASWVRRRVIAPAVAHYAQREFPSRGLFVELGCGTGESSRGVTRAQRNLVGLDISLSVLSGLRDRPPYRSLVAADLRALPFADGSVTGVWNLGVMEHFPETLGLEMLAASRRILAPEGVALFFWPPEHGSSRLLLGPIEALLSRFRRAPYRFFPDEVNRLRSRAHGRELLRRAGFTEAAAEFSWRDFWIHVVVVGRRGSAGSAEGA